MMMFKIIILTTFSLIFLSGSSYGKEVKQIQYWESYKKQFLQKDGRIIDYHQKSISHSEGQGYGLLLALDFNDEISFKSIWLWTKNNLQRSDDNLFSWSWGKDENNNWQVLDPNNATDGDVLIAYALMLAAKKWSEKTYHLEALDITQSIVDKLQITVNKKIFLLPGEYGFTDKKHVRLNPSYQILSAYDLFSTHSNHKTWIKIKQDANWLIQQSFNEATNLPADWLWFDLQSGALIKRSPQFGYEAIRIYLYQFWEKKRTIYWSPQTMFEFFEKNDFIYSQFEFSNANKQYPYSALSGIYQIYALQAKQMGRIKLANKLHEKALEKLLQGKQEYYGYSLFLLAGMTI